MAEAGGHSTDTADSGTVVSLHVVINVEGTLLVVGNRGDTVWLPGRTVWPPGSTVSPPGKTAGTPEGAVEAPCNGVDSVQLSSGVGVLNMVAETAVVKEVPALIPPGPTGPPSLLPGIVTVSNVLPP